MAFFSKDKNLSDILNPLATIADDVSALIVKNNAAADAKRADAAKLVAEADALDQESKDAAVIAQKLHDLITA